MGDVAVRALDVEGEVLYETSLESSVANPTAFNVRLPDLAGIEYIELRREGATQDVITRSAMSPIVSVISPEPFEQMGNRSVVKWNVEDNDSSDDEIVVDVMYSPDAGHRWWPLAVSWPGKHGQLLFDSSKFPTGASGIVRVEASDGLNITAATVENVVITQNHAPQVAISYPSDGDVFAAGSNVILLGSASDIDDGWLDLTTGAPISPSMSWTSNINGAIGSGRVMNFTSMTSGVHQITLTATDASGQQSSDSVSIVIQ